MHTGEIQQIAAMSPPPPLPFRLVAFALLAALVAMAMGAMGAGSLSVGLIYATHATCLDPDEAPLLIVPIASASVEENCTQTCLGATSNQLVAPESCLPHLAAGWPGKYVRAKKISGADCSGSLVTMEKFVRIDACIPVATDTVVTDPHAAVIIRCPASPFDTISIDVYSDPLCQTQNQSASITDVGYCGDHGYLYVCPEPERSASVTTTTTGEPEESKTGARAGVVTIAVFLSLFGLAVVLVLVRSRK